MAAWDRLGGRPRRFGGTQGGSGTGRLSDSRIVQRWSVRPAAIAGVHFRRCPVPAVIRRLSWTQQELEAQPTKSIPAVRAPTLRANARPRRAGGRVVRPPERAEREQRLAGAP